LRANNDKRQTGIAAGRK